MDGKHIRMKKPKGSGSKHFCYKNFHSIVLLAIADADYRFLYIDVGSYGKDSDSTIFQNSSFFHKLENGDLNLPPSKPLPGMNKNVPHVFLGDEAFSLSQHVLRPYSGKFLSYKKRIFNYRQSRGRRYIECSFGILSNKWRIFHRPLDVNRDFAIQVVKACCALHNYVIKRDEHRFDDMLSVEGFVDFQQQHTIVQGGNRLNQMREVWADYFVSDLGSVPWQHNCI